MELALKQDWDLVQQRYEAWWAGEMLDRPIVKVTAPKRPSDPADAAPADRDALFDWFTNPELVLPRVMHNVERTYWGGDAFPLVFPFSCSLPAIEAAYLGCPYDVVPGSNTGWADPCIENWEDRTPIVVDPDNKWWQITQQLLDEGARQGVGKYVVGIPDLQGGGEIIALMRGNEELAMDLILADKGDIMTALREEVHAWHFYYQTCFEIIHRHMDGYVDWLGVWSEVPCVTVENDFSGMISTKMFEEFFMPSVAQQCEWVDRTMYHLDGPDAVRHTDTLLALSTLNGIQWVPGAGAPPCSKWIPLLQKIQRAGKLLYLNVEPWEVSTLLEELAPGGVILDTHCASVEEADALLEMVQKMFR